jgi:hypothetical protein
MSDIKMLYMNKPRGPYVWIARVLFMSLILYRLAAQFLCFSSLGKRICYENSRHIVGFYLRAVHLLVVDFTLDSDFGLAHVCFPEIQHFVEMSTINSQKVGKLRCI